MISGISFFITFLVMKSGWLVEVLWDLLLPFLKVGVSFPLFPWLGTPPSHHDCSERMDWPHNDNRPMGWRTPQHLWGWAVGTCGFLFVQFLKYPLPSQVKIFWLHNFLLASMAWHFWRQMFQAKSGTNKVFRTSALPMSCVFRASFSLVFLLPSLFLEVLLYLFPFYVPSEFKLRFSFS